MIEMPDRAARAYLHSFNVAAVYVIASRTGSPCSIGAGRNLPAGCRAAWWTDCLESAHTVRELALACALRGAERESRTFLRVTIEQAGAAILAAANRLGIVLHDHAAVIARAKAAVQRLDTELAKARERGDLRSFNFEYRRRRLAGARLPPYGIMLDRYRAALASSIAGNTPPWEIITVVFGERS